MKYGIVILCLGAAVLAASEQNCEDKDKRCSTWKVHCQTNNYVKNNCHKSCNTCAAPTPPAPPPTPAPTTPVLPGPDCNDKDNRCSTWKKYCKKNRYVKKKCQKTCDTCGGPTKPPPLPTRPPRPQTPVLPKTPVPSGPGGCGIKPGTRIVGGTEAPESAWPWQAMIRDELKQFCGGTLVHPQWVVTAAHCVVKKTAEEISVRMGAHHRNNKVGTEQDFKVERIITHPSYHTPTTYAHDIALLKLDRPAFLNRAVGLACMPNNGYQIQEGKKCWVTGWGALKFGGVAPDVLMQVSVPLVSRDRCSKAYPGRVHKSMICAGVDQGGIDSCKGDSGGPLVCENGGRFYLEGAVSWGIGCADAGKFGVYADVRYLQKWLESNMNV